MEHPAFDITHVLRYTDEQLSYYMQEAAIPVDQLPAVATAIKSRREILDALRHGSDDRPSARPPVRSTETTTMQARVNDEADEPDSDYPAYAKEWKGIKIDHTITKLKQDGGLANYNLWLGDLRNAFVADPNRFPTGATRIILAVFNTDGTIRSQHAAVANQDPLLRTHWRRFLRWVRENTLYGEADRSATLDKWTEVRQGLAESPAAFYSRLVTLAAELDQAVGRDQLLPRLQRGLRNTLVRTARTGQTVQELVYNAQEVWGIFGYGDTSRNHPEKDGKADKPNGSNGARGQP
jgi:hypothetical protein